ncbi:MAG: FIST N-terminal domain-containing protein, partial [Melioribacteraceae bacterium]|nr:FIST N-terminal domain-containing protein [Melioribacteraceae bacterium]
RGFVDIIGEEVNVFGGMAGDNQAFKEQFVFTNNKSTNNGIVSLVLDSEKIKIAGVATCGWKAVGTEKTVTKSEGNHVFTIDNMPVLDLTIKYGGLEELQHDNLQQAIEIGTNFPLQLQREKGDPVMRPGLKIDWNDGSFYCSGPVPQGSKVKFSLPPDFDVVETVIHEVDQLKKQKIPEADAVIVFSCAGRTFALGPFMNREIEGIKNTWNVPMVGMFSTAELARAKNGNLEMHALTTCCIVLKEK